MKPMVDVLLGPLKAGPKWLDSPRSIGEVSLLEVWLLPTDDPNLTGELLAGWGGARVFLLLGPAAHHIPRSGLGIALNSPDLVWGKPR